MRRQSYPVLCGLVLTAALAAGGSPALGATWVSWDAPATTNVPVGSSVTLSGRVGADGAVGGLELLLTIDLSGSMAAPAAATKEAAKDLVNRLAGASAPVRVGVIGFTSAATVYLQPTPLDTGKSDVISAIDDLPDPSGSTWVDNAMLSARQTFLLARYNGSDRRQVGLMVSDGFFNQAGVAAARAAQDWSAYGISWYAAGVPTSSGTLNDINVDELAGIAEQGHGAYAQVVGYLSGNNTWAEDTAAVGSLASALSDEASAAVEVYGAFLVLPDGNRVSDFGLGPDGTFSYTTQVSGPGARTFTLEAYGTDGSRSQASLTLYGVPASTPVSPVPEPGTLILVATGLGALAARRGRNRGNGRRASGPDG